MTMETQNSLAEPLAEILIKSPLSSPNYTRASHKSLFLRTFGRYISRSSGHVQPRHLDFTELLRLVEELRDRESRLKTELLEHKLLKESLAIVPVLENEIYLKEAELERALIRIERLNADNERLNKELEKVRQTTEEERRKTREMMKVLEDEMVQLKKMKSDRLDVKPTLDDDESSGSRKIQRSMEVSINSNLISHFKERNECINTFKNKEDQELKAICAKNRADTERPNYSECKSEALAESALLNLKSDHSTSSKSSKIQPFVSSISTKLKLPPAPPPTAPVNQILQPPSPLSKSVPPPPPLPSKGKRLIRPKVRRVPELVEFYHSLMRRDSRKDCSSAVIDVRTGANARDMIGEIENRSAYLLAIKMDVETKGEFIKHLIKKVEDAEFTNIEDVVTFVKWLDDELSYLVDERAVLKHFEWPEQKADVLREAAFGYSDLKKLVLEVSSLDDCRQPPNITLKKNQALLEKLEHGVYNLCRMRESATKRYRVFHIPMDWMLDTGIVSQIKVKSLKLAVEYLKRVSAELDTVYSCSKEQLIIQGVRFAFRVHQFAGGFDMEAITAFQELREKVRFCQGQELKAVGCSTAD